MADLLIKRPTFEPREARREFKLAASDYAVALILRPAIERLASVAPGIQLTLADLSDDSVRLLRSGERDLAFFPVGERPIAADLHAEIVLRDTWCCAAWAGNTAIGPTLTREIFEELPHIVDGFSVDPDQGAVNKILSAHDIHRRYVVRTKYTFLTPFLLKGTSALAVLPRRLSNLLSVASDLRIFSLPFDSPDFIQEMCWSGRHTSDPAHAWLRGFLIETVEDKLGAHA
jgi:DNA-binding transcriptional LysR family regulator